MSLTLIWVALLFAALDWAAVARGWKVLSYIAKPAVMVCLIAWLGVNGGWSGVLLWFTAGLIFSLAGDIFLMLPKERFVAGLVAFLLAHLAYIIGLNTHPLPVNIASLLVLIAGWADLHHPVFALGAGAGGDGGPQAQDTRAGIHAGAQPDALLGAAHLRAPGVVARGGAAGGAGGGALLPLGQPAGVEQVRQPAQAWRAAGHHHLPPGSGDDHAWARRLISCEGNGIPDKQGQPDALSG